MANPQKYMFAPGHGRARGGERFWYHDGNVYSSYTPDGLEHIVPGTQANLDEMIAKGILIPSDVEDVKILVWRLLRRTAKYEEK